MSDADIKHIIKTASIRLGETISLFAASKAVSDRCHQDVNPLLFEYVNKNQFWRTSYAAFQISLFINISALVDTRSDCATFQTAADLLSKQNSGLIPEEVFSGLQSIRERYKIFRHKVFAHTDHKRAELADEFDAAGFSWEAIAADINMLDYIRQVLWAVDVKKPVPTREEASTILSVDHLEAMQISADVDHLFKLIANDL
jgi:hypothetical protein